MVEVVFSPSNVRTIFRNDKGRRLNIKLPLPTGGSINYAAGISTSHQGSAVMAIPAPLSLLGGGTIADPVRSAFREDRACPEGGHCGSAVRLPGGSAAVARPDPVFSAPAAIGRRGFISQPGEQGVEFVPAVAG